ncbi:MAG: type II secretion system GspH family protein [Burkholderiaceae bacterium]|nr:type II secretion system GspH family protein [Sulfuritalea sp.]MCF8176537.1 type II secretion system GspH family protein [Burkholderiaceae bacterium]
MKLTPVTGRGFTLIEMAMVLLIVAMLLGGGLSVISAQIAQQKFKDSQKILDDAKEALIGYAAANGRLPCPASAASNGIESPVGGSTAVTPCTNPYNGFLPAVTLGMPNPDANGYLQDAWQGPTNRIRYAVTTAIAPGANANAATTPNGIRTATLATYGAAPNLRVCGSATGITATTCGAAPVLTTSAVAVVFSLGANGQTGVVGGIDEAANQNNDQVFVSHPPVAIGGVNGEFDDMFTWIPAAVLFNRMLQAGSLP